MSRAGGLSWQVTEMFDNAGMLDIGRSSDHKTKTEYRQELMADNVKGAHHLSQRTPVTNSATWDKIKGNIIELGKYQRATGAGNRLSEVTDGTIRGFLASKQGSVSESTLNGIRYSLNKMGACLGEERSASIFKVTQEFKGCGVEKPQEKIRFDNPQAVIDRISDPRCQEIAQLQLDTGLRVNDARYIRLNGDGHSIEVHSKAGRVVKEFEVGAQHYQKLQEFSGGKMQFSLSTINHYRYELKKAAKAVGEKMSRTHSFRHNFANKLYHDLRSEGYGHNEARAIVSETLFHERLDIVDRYIDN